MRWQRLLSHPCRSRVTFSSNPGSTRGDGVGVEVGLYRQDRSYFAGGLALDNPGNLVIADPERHTIRMAIVKPKGSSSLSVARTGKQFTVSWPSNGISVVLESSSSLTAPTQWRPVTNSVGLQNGRSQVTIGMDSSHQFFRLRNP